MTLELTNIKKALSLLFVLAAVSSTQAQEKKKDVGEIHGNFDLVSQYYNVDTLIGAPLVDEKIRMNAFSNLIYTKGKFSAGLRFEAYHNAVLGFNDQYRGNGIPFRYASYSVDKLDITIGHFYEQFGNGQILRAYEERGLGIDNVIDGIRVKGSPLKGLVLKGIIGEQRNYFDEGPGIVRGFDVDVQLNSLLKSLETSKTRFSFGASAVSKYQQDNNSTYTLPENVLAYSVRGRLIRGDFSLDGEYTYKYNDPSLDNNFIFKDGQSALVSAAYSRKGLGITFSVKHTDNMFFRSDRNNNSVFNDLFINYMPALTRQHTYNLAATLYPYATQPRGEVAFQTDVIYKIKRKTALGGKYGTTIAVNYALAYNIDTVSLNDRNSSRLGYETNFFGVGDRQYFGDFNVEVARKFNKKFKAKFTYIYLHYDMEIIQGLGGKPNVHANIGVADLLFKLNKKHAIRTELQSLTTPQDQGNWATVVVEYTYSPHWTVAVMDQWNYGNSDPTDRLHYPYLTVGYVKNANRIMLSYGRQRAGIFCVGGVCRVVPASNGFNIAITSSF